MRVWEPCPCGGRVAQHCPSPTCPRGKCDRCDQVWLAVPQPDLLPWALPPDSDPHGVVEAWVRRRLDRHLHAVAAAAQMPPDDPRRRALVAEELELAASHARAMSDRWPEYFNDLPALVGQLWELGQQCGLDKATAYGAVGAGWNRTPS